jgi:acyl transferase domain-containing protein
MTQTDIDNPGYWRRHVREPVLFKQGIETLERGGCSVFLEIGPSPVLTALGQNAISSDGCIWVPTLRKGHDDYSELLRALAMLHVGGVGIDGPPSIADAAAARFYYRRIPSSVSVIGWTKRAANLHARRGDHRSLHLPASIHCWGRGSFRYFRMSSFTPRSTQRLRLFSEIIEFTARPSSLPRPILRWAPTPSAN